MRLPHDALRRFPRQLSGGQAQRVSLMRALMLDPEVLLLDEPLGALDPMTRFDLQQDLRDAFARLGKTVVMVTHDLAEAAFLAGNAVLLRDGRIAILFARRLSPKMGIGATVSEDNGKTWSPDLILRDDAAPSETPIIDGRRRS